MFFVSNKGITPIQWLVFAGILGIVIAIAVWYGGVSRAKSRDAARVAYIKQIQAGLELFYNDKNTYPLSPERGLILGGANTRCLDAEGFKANCSGTVYLNYIPAAPFPADKKCSNSTNIYRYFSQNGSNYAITFCLGRAVGKLAPGQHQASFGKIR